MNPKDIIYISFNEENFKNQAIFCECHIEAWLNLKKQPTRMALIRPISLDNNRAEFEFVDMPGVSVTLTRYPIHSLDRKNSLWNSGGSAFKIKSIT